MARKESTASAQNAVSSVEVDHTSASSPQKPSRSGSKQSQEEKPCKTKKKSLPKKKAVSRKQKAASKPAKNTAGGTPAVPVKRKLPGKATPPAGPSMNPPTDASAAETTAKEQTADSRQQTAGPNGFPLLSLSQLSEHCDIDRSVARRRLKAAKIKPEVNQEKKKLFELTPEVEELLAESGDPQFDEVRLEDAQISKEIKRARFEQMTGRSVDFNEACEYFGLLLKGLYTRFDTYPTTAALRIHKLKSSKEVSSALRRDFRKIFGEFRADPGRFAK